MDNVEIASRTPQHIARFYTLEQLRIIELHREVCQTCDQNQKNDYLTVQCRSCGCAGVSFLNGSCKYRKWP